MYTKEQMLKAADEAKKLVASGQIMAAIVMYIGEPKDAINPVPKILELFCEIPEPLEPGDDCAYFSAGLVDKKVYLIDSTGTVTSVQVTPSTPTTISFVNNLTQEDYIDTVSLLTAKYDVIGNKKANITRALDNEGVKKVILTVDTAVPVGNRIVLASGTTKFTYSNLISMLSAVQDYGEKFVLLVGSQVDQDMILWDYDENKYHSLKSMFEDLNIEKYRVVGKVYRRTGVSGGLTERDVLAANKALLIGTSTAIGKPCLYARRKLNKVLMLGGELSEDATRTVIQSPSIMPIGGNRLPAQGIVGFESLAIAVRNTYALAGFYRGASWVAEVG